MPRDKNAAKRNGKDRKRKDDGPSINLKPEAAYGIAAIVSGLLSVFLILAAFNGAGVVGERVREILTYLVGVGYIVLPLAAIAGTIFLIRRQEATIEILKTVGLVLFVVSALGLIGIVSPANAGIIGRAIGEATVGLFAAIAGTLILAALLAISLIIIFNTGLALPKFALPQFSLPAMGKKEADTADEEDTPEEEDESPEEEVQDEPEEERDEDVRIAAPVSASAGKPMSTTFHSYGDYTPPPLSLLEKDKGKAGGGDVKANANLIKRTLQNFGIQVEMDEVSIGPSVTRYALKPAEGVRLSKIVSLQTNLELALAAHPVRIEAPIPGKSLVGVEVPNSSKATVGLASLLGDRQFAESDKPLLVALGRDIAGQAHFANMAKMPHLLVAGATGSGKSVSIHSLVTSLLYRNSPERLRLIMIDPKRVELTLYNNIPHLLTPVITDPKKTILALKWATKEMERRYSILETESVRDIESYHSNVYAKSKGTTEEGEGPEPMPYIVIFIDELADIMQIYPRELEACVVRLAQMSRAVGIHLVLSTQRPSVNVITGLIKANIPARMALQVASQIDSRTILDQGGAESLLGAGDMLYLSSDMGKPKRLQTAFISENEVKKVASFIKSHNERDLTEIDFAEAGKDPNALWNSGALGGDGDDGEDDLYDDARAAVEEAGKASTSYLQRKLRIGYSRAARLMDILEQRGVIGPADGAKPREVIRGGTGAAETENEA